MRFALSRQKFGIAVSSALVLIVLGVGAGLTHTAAPSAQVGSFYLIDGVAAGIMLALITHIRRALAIYLCLAGFAVTLQPLFSRLPFQWFISDAVWERLPESGMTFLGIFPTVTYIVGLVALFALAGYHAADPISEEASSSP